MTLATVADPALTGSRSPAGPTGGTPRNAVPLAIGLAVAVGTGLIVGRAPLVLGLMGLSVLLAALWRPELATLTFFFVLFANLLAVATRFHGVPAAAAGGFVLILCIPLLHHLVVRRCPVVVTPALPLILGYLAAMLIAAASSATVTAAVGPIGEFLVEGLLLYILVSNVVRTPEALRRVVWTIVLAASLMGMLSVVQDLTRSYDNDFAGLAQVTAQGFQVGEDLDGKVLRPRLSGPIGEQNRYAQILLVAAPLALFRGLYEEDRRLRALAALCGASILAGIVLTFSRGAMVASAGLFLLLVARRHVRARHAVVALCVVGASIIAVEPDYAVRLSSLARVGGLASESPDQQADGAAVGRATSALAAWNTFVDHPITGVGPGRYFLDYSQQAANELNLRFFDNNRRAHNMYLEVAADLGLLGIVTLLTAVAVTAAQLAAQQRYWRSRRPELAALASSILFALAAYMATAVFLHLAYQRYFWMLLGLANATVWILAGERRRAAQPAAVREGQHCEVAVG